MKDVKRLVYVIVCAVFFIGLYILSDFYAGEAVGKYASEITSGGSPLNSNKKLTMDDLSIENQIAEQQITSGSKEICLSFVGDITFESDQLDRYYDSDSQSFDFTNSFKYIQSYLKSSDIVSGNLEAVMAGPDENYENVFDQYGTADFLYNAPEIGAKNISEAGVSLLQTANSHSADFGIDGIKSTLRYLSEAGIKTVGTKNSASDRGYTMISVKGVKIAYVAYTNELNGSLDDSETYAVNTLDGYDSEKIEQMLADIQAARQEGADFVTAMVYAGDAYNTEPDDNQKALFDALFDAGADIVVGTGPYGLQPVEIRDLTDSDGTSRKGVAIYSLGTFLGSEVYDWSLVNNDVSAVFDVIISKEGSEKPTITGIRLTPTCITYTETDIFVLPAAQAKNNPSDFESIVDDTANERILSACDTIIPGLLENTELTGSYSGNTYVINF